MESLLIYTRKHFLTIFPINNHFEAEIREIGSKYIWSSKLRNFSSKDFNFCKALHIYCSRFFLINSHKQSISFSRGLQGGGCFGSKAKVIEVNVITSRVENTEKPVQLKSISEKNSKPVTEFNANSITKDLKENSSKVLSEKDEELGKICLEISNGFDFGYLDSLFIAKVKILDLFECKNISQNLRNFAKSLKLDVLKRFWFNKNVIKVLAGFLKELIIVDVLQDDRQFEQSIESFIPEIEKIVNWIVRYNDYSNCVSCEIKFNEICEILKNYKQACEIFNGLKKQINHSNILETFNKIQENSFTTPIKFYLILKSILKTNQPAKQIEFFFKSFFDSCLSYSKYKLFDFLSSVKSLLISGHLSPEFLQTHYLKYSALAQSQDPHIRMIAINFLKFLSSYSNPMLSSSSKGLLNTLIDQEQIYSIKSQIFPKPLKNSVSKIQSNIDLNNSEPLFTRREELEIMNQIIESKSFVEISGKPSSGKTTLAIQYAKINKYSYDVVWKVNSEQPELDLINLGQVLGSGKDFKALLRILNEGKFKILIIFDNASNLNKVTDYMIKSDFVHFIAITVRQVWKNCVNLDERFDDFYRLYLDFGKFIGLEESELDVFKSNLICLRVGLGIKANYLLEKRKMDKGEVNNVIEDYIEKADHEVRYCLGIISYLEYSHVPEKMVYEIFCKKFSCMVWNKAKSEIIQIGFIINTENEGELWNTNEFIHNICSELLRSSDIESELTDFFISNFTNDSNQDIGYSFKAANQSILHPLTFHALNYFYLSELTEKSLVLGLSLLQNLSLINYDSKILQEIIEIIEEKIKEVSSSNKTLSTINNLKALSKFAIRILNPELGFSIFYDYLKLFEDLIDQNKEVYLNSIIEFSNLPEIPEEQEAIQEIFLSALSNPSLISSPLLPEIQAKCSDSLILTNKYEEARTFIESSLKKFSNSDSSPSLSQSLSTLYLNLGYLQFIKEEFVLSEQNLQIAKKIIEKSNQVQSSIYLSCLLYLSETFIYTSKEPDRQGILMDAYNLAKSFYAQTHPDLIFITSQLSLLECSASQKENYVSSFLLFKSQFSEKDDLHLLDFRQSYDSLIVYKRHIYLIEKGIETFSSMLDR